MCNSAKTRREENKAGWTPLPGSGSVQMGVWGGSPGLSAAPELTHWTGQGVAVPGLQAAPSGRKRQAGHSSRLIALLRIPSLHPQSAVGHLQHKESRLQHKTKVTWAGANWGSFPLLPGLAGTSPPCHRQRGDLLGVWAAEGKGFHLDITHSPSALLFH